MIISNWIVCSTASSGWYLRNRTSKVDSTAFCEGNSLVVVELPSQRVNNAKTSLQWRHNGHDGISNHQPHSRLLNRLFRRRSKKTSKLRVTGLCAGNSPVTGDFPAQRASNAENVSIWWRHHAFSVMMSCQPRILSFCLNNKFCIKAGTFSVPRCLPSNQDDVGWLEHIDGLVQDCSISSVLAMEILQSCTKPSISRVWVSLFNVLPSCLYNKDHKLIEAEWRIYASVN